MNHKVVIIGAGIGGLATANLLAKKGYEVHIYERHSAAGGRAGQKTQDGFLFDTGPSWYLMPEVFERYYNLLDTSAKEQLDLQRLNPAYRVYYEDGSQITITSDLEKDAATFESIESGAGQSLRKYVKKSELIYQLSLKRFLYSNFDTPRSILHTDIVRHGLTMMRLAFTPMYSYVRRFVTHPKLQKILEYPMVFLGSSPFQAPAIYSLMGALDFKEGVFYPQGGIYTIITSLERIGKELGVTYHYNQPVAQIKSQNGRATAIRLENGAVVTADSIISNADLHFTETQLLAPEDQSYPEKYWARKQASPSALLMYLGVKGEIPEFPHHTLLFVDAWKENFKGIFTDKTPPEKASLYICKPSQTDDTVAPEGHENIFVLVPLPANMPLGQNSGEAAEKLADHYLEQIKFTTGVDLADRQVTRSLFTPDDFSDVYNSWQSSMLGPSHILGQSAFFRTPNKSKKLPNLYYTGAGTMPGIGLPMCIIGAELVVERIEKANKKADR